MELTHIACTGGGSGGHISPIGSLIEYGLEDSYIANHCKLFRFGERDSLEQRFAASYPEVTFVSVPTGKFRRYLTLKTLRQNSRDLFKVLFSIFIAAKKLRQQKIDVVFCKGGYVALPVCVAARILRIPIYLHESDMHAGLTNRRVAKMAKTVFSGFPESIGQSVVVGQILSPKLLSPVKKLLPLVDLDTKTVVLVMGGAQGAAVIFDSLLTLLEQKRVDSSFHFLVVLGTKNLKFQEKFLPYEQVMTYEFIYDQRELAGLYQASDLAVTRGAMTSLAEQQLFGLKKLIVPLPFTGGNHQWHNAMRCVKHRGDELIEQDNQLGVHIEDYLKRQVGYKKTASDLDMSMVTFPLEMIRTYLLPKQV